MSNSNLKKQNAIGEPLWIDVLKTSRSFIIFMVVVAVVGGSLGIAVIAPWGRASPDCSIYCVIMNKLGDPIRWDELKTETMTEGMIAEVERELDVLDFSFGMPNYKQHGIWLTGERYEILMEKINAPMAERTHPGSGKAMNIAEELFYNIKSSKYMDINSENDKKIKIKILNKIFVERKNIILSNEFDIARPQFEVAAEIGDANAQYQLGLLYHKGKEYEQDLETAVRWYTLAAKQGHVPAQYNLGLMYHKGDGVPQKYESAVKWYRLAAERQHARAQHKLGLMYYHGHGVQQDKKAAEKWWKLSSRQGFAGS
tara:strand:+ start:13 stop:951 length:939 start_codon:yes stop_codon:yes gene_type:complete